MARYTDKQKAALDTLMKDEVYEHAMKIIVDEDLGALTMDRLATEVGVSRGTLYNYFSDKDAVIDYLEERTFEPLLHAIKELSAKEDPPEVKLTMVAEWIFDAIFKDRALIMALTPAKHCGANRPCQMDRRTRGLSAFATMIQHGIESGDFRDLDPHLMSEFFFGSISGLIESMSLSGNFLPPEDVVPPLMELFLGGLRKSR